MRIATSSLLTLLAACGTPFSESVPEVPLELHGPPGTFETTSSGYSGMRNLVVAIDEAGQLHRAAIYDHYGWPVFVDLKLPERFPGEPTLVDDDQPLEVDSLSLVSSKTGDLHAVWSDGLNIHYARFVDGARRAGEWRRIACQCDEAQPALAIADDDTVTIAYVEGYSSRSPTRRMMIVQGTIERGFGAPEYVNATDESSYSVSGASLELDQRGDIHLAYSWHNREGVTILDYVRKQGGEWRNIRRSDDVSSSDSNVHLDLVGDGAYLAWINNARTQIIHDIGRGSIEIPIEGEIHRLRMNVSDDHKRHLVAEYSPAGIPVNQTRLVYFGYIDERVELTELSPLLNLSPGTGGSLVGPNGDFVLPYTNGGEVYVAVRHE
jgi:hypothetical protein